MTPFPPNLASSVRARLLNVAKAQGADFQQMLTRFALERILYRLSRSPHADRFLLKGALLFTLWYDMPHRATRDADLLGYGASDAASVALAFRDIATVVVDDGIVFDPASVVAEEIRKEASYAGVRVIITGELAKARCKTQIDVGFGDAVTPGPVDSVYPVLLPDLPAPHLRTYPTYTVIAEKLHAIALLGMTNSRLKDYFDLAVLLERELLDPDLLAQAIAATFERRGMAAPTGVHWSQLPITLHPVSMRSSNSLGQCWIRPRFRCALSSGFTRQRIPSMSGLQFPSSSLKAAEVAGVNDLNVPFELLGVNRLGRETRSTPLRAKKHRAGPASTKALPALGQGISAHFLSTTRQPNTGAALPSCPATYPQARPQSAWVTLQRPPAASALIIQRQQPVGRAGHALLHG